MATQMSYDENDVLNLYKKAFNIKIPMHSVIDDDFYEWLTLFEKATNCSKFLVLPSILSLTATLCGPKSDVSTRGGEFSNALNEYLIAVCDPGGGKSNTYSRVVQPVIDHMYRRHMLHIQLENYTSAGIQKHQTDNKGYGIITGDEGHRFMSSITMKQSKGESEKALLCKLWGGRGDANVLANGVRGFDRTSMSACVFIQPEPLLKELVNLKGNDGLMDRFLLISAKPVFHKCQIVRENYVVLKESKMMDFVQVMENIYVAHTAGIRYTLSEKAQDSYEEMVDAYADYVRDKYNSDEEEKENSLITCSPENEGMDCQGIVTSKDTLHILRLSALLHILHQYINPVLGGEVMEIQHVIPRKRLLQAKTLYNSIVQHKALFLQAVSQENGKKVHIKSTMTFRERVVNAVCKSRGPAVSTRALQRQMKGALSDSVKVELEELQRTGFGVLKKVRCSVLFSSCLVA
ncbi:uncharacterized protein LOC123526803 [Mercenaria mercenaria]|uniref:uncharacterized protein LOC123526803 n=1 Tax=Mercenaria mercenaria TaxID=6596 RepID=UPI00234F5AF9|nr:uncharacterized protein LOC123526803 [Mercenaria mercenaria]